MQELKLKIKGLYTHPNDLSEVPEGALSVADDIVIDRESVAEPRRGFNRSNGAFSDSSYRATKLFTYQNYLFAHYSTNLLAYYSTQLASTTANFTGTGAWTAISGTYTPATDTKMRAAEANQNFYFTSAAGNYKLDAYNATPATVGAYKGLDLSASVSASASTWLTNNFRTAYRVVWGRRDANNNLILGAPSQRESFKNTAGSTKAVDLRITIPTGVTTAWFFQVYRAAMVDNTALDTEPSDEMGLVYEANPTSTDITNKYVDISDITPDALRGATIYTAATQQGLANGNEQPPMAKDLGAYKNSLFYANTTSRHRYYLSMLAVGGASGVTANDLVSIGGVLYTAKATESIANAEFAVVTTGSASQNIRDTAISLVRVINRNTSSTVYAYYLSTSDELPGQILLEERSIGGSPIYFGASRPASWSPSSAPAITGYFGTNTVTETITSSSPHGLVAGDGVVFSATPGSTLPSPIVGGALYYVLNPTSTTFQIALTVGGTAVNLTSGMSGTGYLMASTQVSSNDRYKNGVYYSKTSEPEAVPLGNYFLVGSATKEILKIVPLRDSLFIFKEDGIYRLSGEDAASFRVDLLDSTAKLIAAETCAVLNNQIFALTDQGVVSVSESGVQVRSRPIESTLLSLQGINASVLRTESFGIGYETERKYILFVPRLAGDTSPTQAFVYNTFTNTWTRWVLNKTCGIVNSGDDKLYLGDASTAYVNQERKSFTYQDFVDYGFEATVSAVASRTLSISAPDDIDEGDVIYQSSSIYSIVDSVDTIAGTVTVAFSAAFTVGTVSVLKAIPSKIGWTPVSGANPGMLKQYREATLLFRTDFTGTGTLAFTSDTSPGEETEEIEGTAIGLWGLFAWGGVPWGGQNVRRPIRVYVPRNKQRCSQLMVEFRHSTGYARYQLTGLSVIANAGSERVAV